MKTEVLRFVGLIMLLALAGPLAVHGQSSNSALDEASTDRGLREQKSYAPYPAPDSGYVTDLAELLTREEEEQIEQWLWKVEEKQGVEIAVVTIGSIKDYPATKASSIVAFARGLFDTYGIGNLPKNDGVLLLVARADRRARIELGSGYGGARDDDVRAIMDRVIVPQFKKGNYGKGITKGVKALMREFGGTGIRVKVNWNLVLLLVAVPAVAMLAFSLSRNGKRGWGWVAVGLLVVLILAIIRIIYLTLKNLPERSTSSWNSSSSSWSSSSSSWSSSSSSWSSGGYGGGFGGGSSGGGGATGSW